MAIECIACDCFGTVFDMSGISRDEIKAYVSHVCKEDFTPFDFPKSWWELRPYPDSAIGIDLLQSKGFACIAMSNGPIRLIERVSRRGGIVWDDIIDLISHRVYKPRLEAYRVIEKQTGHKPANTLMVTANPTFGDVEGAAAIGMQSQVIRQPGMPKTFVELAELLNRRDPPTGGTC